jgi:uncharacterized protein YndB with AHSA1/START domain
MNNSSKFIYIIYIRTTQERIWAAITNPHLTRQFWGHENISDWKEGSKWQHIADDNKRTIKLVGKIIKFRPKELMLTWANPANLEDNSHVTFKIEHTKEAICLKVIHSDFKVGSKMLDMIKIGWPRVLSSMKSFLETGRALITWDN